MCFLSFLSIDIEERGVLKLESTLINSIGVPFYPLCP